MFKIVYASNNYYLCDGVDFFGPYHSMADAEVGRHTIKQQHKLTMEDAARNKPCWLQDY